MSGRWLVLLLIFCWMGTPNICFLKAAPLQLTTSAEMLKKGGGVFPCLCSSPKSKYLGIFAKMTQKFLPGSASHGQQVLV